MYSVSVYRYLSARTSRVSNLQFCGLIKDCHWSSCLCGFLTCKLSEGLQNPYINNHYIQKKVVVSKMGHLPHCLHCATVLSVDNKHYIGAHSRP